MAELVSTRDPNIKIVSYTDALMGGLAPDGGLLTPIGAEYPGFAQDELVDMKGLPYAMLAYRIKNRLIGDDIPLDVQLAVAQRAYDPAAFPESKNGEIAPMVEAGKNLYIKFLTLGSTVAFKDFGLRSLAEEVDYVLTERDEWLDILGASSGDTVSAAEDAFKNIGRKSMFMLTPLKGTMSPFQRAQAGVLSSDRIHNISYDGGFTDCQSIVKELKQMPEFADLGAVNSINWGRIVAQVAYYFDAYLQVMGDRIGEEVDFVVPTGNFGNVLAGHVARRMGLPIRNLIIATNENNVLDNLVQHGVYARPAQQHDTSSPSMDIIEASNYERLVYEMFDANTLAVSEYMKQFKETGRVSLTGYGLPADALQRIGFDSGTSTHADRIASIRKIYADSEGSIIIDPHTADAVTVANRLPRDVPTICLATAAPVKFEQTMEEALGFIPEREARFKGLEDSPNAQNFVVIDSVEALKRYIRQHRPRRAAFPHQ